MPINIKHHIYIKPVGIISGNGGGFYSKTLMISTQTLVYLVVCYKQRKVREQGLYSFRVIDDNNT